MRLVKRGNYLLRAKIGCPRCHSILEITRNDLINPYTMFDEGDRVVDCCVCDFRISVSKEIVTYLNR